MFARQLVKGPDAGIVTPGAAILHLLAGSWHNKSSDAKRASYGNC